MKEMRNTKHLLIAAVIIVSVLITGSLLLALFNSGYRLPYEDVDMAASGQFGDYVGGIIGTIFSAGAFYFLFLSILEQKSSLALQEKSLAEQTRLAQRSKFEGHFFEILKIHRENVNELTYTRFQRATSSRKVFKAIHYDFLDCYEDLKFFFNHQPILDAAREEHLTKINQIRVKGRIEADIIQMLHIDIAYAIVYFGVAIEGRTILSKRLKRYYKDDFVEKLIAFISLKPHEDHKGELSQWAHFIAKSDSEREAIIREILILISGSKSGVSAEAEELHVHIKDCTKFYGGHQHRLSHYFRNLFQAYKYLDQYSDMTHSERYFFAKTLRSQLSTYEQVVFFLNSVSHLGWGWELGVNSNSNLVTKYQIIKNVPNDLMFDIDFERFYPEIKFESYD